MYLLKEKLMNGSVEVDSWETLFDMSFQDAVNWIKNTFSDNLENITIWRDLPDLFSYTIEHKDNIFPIYGVITTESIKIIKSND